MLEQLSLYRRFIVTGALVLVSLGFLVLFSESDALSPVFQSFIVSIVFFLVIPILYCKIVLKEPLGNIGWQKGNVSAGVLASIVSIILAGAIVIGLALTFPAFDEQYIFPVSVETNFFWFILYELVLVTFMVLLYEVFFRGLVQTLWLRMFGVKSIVIQAVLFASLIYVGQDISWQGAPLLIFCPFAGIIAYRAQSIWYSIVASWTFLFLTDVFFIVFH